MTDFAAIHAEALVAAQKNAETRNEQLGPEQLRGLDCGFAWVEFAGTTAWARWAKKNANAQKHWHRGLYIWGSKIHTVVTQSIGVDEAAAAAYVSVLQKHGIDARMNSRLD